MGCHFDSGYAHQPQLLHSQMLWGGSFEFGAWPNTRFEPPSMTSKPGAAVSLGPAMVRAISGQSGSMRVELTAGGYARLATHPAAPLEVQFAGWANRGLGNAGLKIEAGRVYEGYLFVRSSGPDAVISVRLEDYTHNTSAGTPTVLAEQTFRDIAPGNWTKLDFNFTAAAGTQCRAISADAGGTRVQPCQAAATEAETAHQRWGGAHLCMQCGGQLSIGLVGRAAAGKKQRLSCPPT